MRERAQMSNPGLRGSAVRRGTSVHALRCASVWFALSLQCTACLRRPAASAAAPAPTRQCPVGGTATQSRAGITDADSSLTQIRVRWAVADLLAALNSREVADLSLRYDWTGNVSQREEFFARARGPVAATRLILDSTGAWWSDAPGRKQQTVCLTLSVQGNNGGGVAWTRKVALRANVLDDGRAAWLSRLQVVDLSP